MKVVIIGTGNTAAVLGKIIFNAQHEIVQIIGRNKRSASLLAKELKANAETDLNKIDKTAGIYILAVSDDSVKKVAKNILLNDKLIVHTAGSLPINVLERASKNYGVLYPLQSLRKEINYLPEIIFFIDGSSPKVISALRKFAFTLSKKVKIANDGQRLKIHLAAVIVSNFINHLFVLAEDFCRKENLNFSDFIPLIQETVFRLQFAHPANLQTGPAVRGDKNVIKKHLQVLKKYPRLKIIYSLLTKSIMAISDRNAT